MSNTERVIIREQADIRREAFTRRLLHTLRETIEVVPMDPTEPVPRVRVEMTDASARTVAPLVEAIAILEAMIWASDGCAGHRDCAHSMEPWEKARTLLAGKWQADGPPYAPWPNPSLGDCLGCDGYILAASEAPYCPTCARLRREGKAL